MRLGEIELVPLLDAKGVFGPLAELWPQVSSAAWDPYRPQYPELFDGDRWRVSLTCYLIRVLPLLDAGRVDEIDDGAEVAPGVFATELKGHDPGHTGVRIGSEAILIADAAGHPAMLDQPDWLFLGDQDPSRAAATREALVGELVDTETLVVCGHYPGTGIGKLTRTENRCVMWREASNHLSDFAV